MNERSPRPGLISVVVPVYNAADSLGEQFDALAAQDYDVAWELIVVDNRSTDASRDIAAAWIAKQGLGRLLEAGGRRSPGAARNAGARVARGDFIAFCDADDVVSPGWLRGLAEAGARSDLVAGRNEGARLNGPAACSCNDVPDPARPHLGFLPVAPGSNCGIWRDVLEALGGFDESRVTGEDAALSWRAQLAGYTLTVADAALVHQRFPASLRIMAPKYFAYGRGDARLYREFGPLGMPRRSGREAGRVWLRLAVGLLPVPSRRPAGRCRWVQLLALSCGRLVGSLGHQVLYL